MLANELARAVHIVGHVFSLIIQIGNFVQNPVQISRRIYVQS